MPGIHRSKFTSWEKRFGLLNQNNSKVPKQNQITPQEYAAIVKYAKKSESISTIYSKNGYKQPTAPHKEWHMDIKYIRFYGSFLFFIGVLDGFSRYIVHHNVRVTMTEFDVEITLQEALEKYPGVHPKVISDNGQQFISKDFGNFIRESGLSHVRISPYYPQSNGKLERFHRSLEEECLKGKALLEIEDARKIIADYVNFYNEKRLHQSLHYLTPKDVLEGKTEQRLKEREEKLEQAKLRRLEYWKHAENVA